MRTPASFKSLQRVGAKVRAQVGERTPTFLGRGALLDFNFELSLGDEPLSEEDALALLEGGHGLRLYHGRWVEVDRAKLKQLLSRLQRVRELTARGLPFATAMHLVTGTGKGLPAEIADIDWSGISAGPWLTDVLAELRSPTGLAEVDTGNLLAHPLFDHQKHGLHWLYLLYKLGLGALLADDMGLGKTLQFVALLVVLKQERARSGEPSRPSLVIAGASLLKNWAEELDEFAPGVRYLIAHSSSLDAAEVRQLTQAELEQYDLILTSGTTALLQPWVATTPWLLAGVDEAQIIKNPAIQQARLLKTLRADMRVALTGTPIENRLTDLWSIMDYANPGLLGNLPQFQRWVRELEASGGFGPLRELIQPYLLRRLKSDKSILKDLPDKTELDVDCTLSPAQVVRYQELVQELEVALAEASVTGRRGVILGFITRFKQLCNHLAHGTGASVWNERDSGKFRDLRRIATAALAGDEKILVFTQYAEACAPIASFLADVCGRPGLVINGKVPVRKRTELRKQFQADPAIPFLVVSLKTGGSGLNLTAASQVVHFDRWWNAAVENQGTDRAHRLGQKKRVLVHRFIVRGTIEDRIDALIDSKRALSEDVLQPTKRLNLNTMSDREILDLVALDIHAMQKAA